MIACFVFLLEYRIGFVLFGKERFFLFYGKGEIRMDYN